MRFAPSGTSAVSVIALVPTATSDHSFDLATPEGADILLSLSEHADVLVENYRPGVMARLGLGADRMRARSPRLIYASISGYGQTGPYRDRPGFARIAHAFGGLTYLSGLPGETPVTPGSTSLGDYMTGLYGCIGIMMALRHRDATGQGQTIDCALYESIFRALDDIAPRFAVDGFVREAEGTGTVNACPHGHFPTGDGKFMAIACTTSKMFERLTIAMQRPDLLERFGDQATRLAARKIVLAEVEAWTTSMPRDEVIAVCTANDVPAGAINSIADIFADPHFKERGTLTTVKVPGVGDVVGGGTRRVL